MCALPGCRLIRVTNQGRNVNGATCAASGLRFVGGSWAGRVCCWAWWWLSAVHGRRVRSWPLWCGSLRYIGGGWMDYGRRGNLVACGSWAAVRVVGKMYGFTVGLVNSVRFSGGCFAAKWAFWRSLCGTKYFACAFQVPNARGGLFAALTFARRPNAVRFSFPAALHNTLQVMQLRLHTLQRWLLASSGADRFRRQSGTKPGKTAPENVNWRGVGLRISVFAPVLTPRTPPYQVP